MVQLPAQDLAAVSHVSFGVFNLALPNIAAWVILGLVFAIAIFARLPRFFEARSETEGEASSSAGEGATGPEVRP